MTSSSRENCPRGPSILPSIIFATILFCFDALMMNFVLWLWLAVVWQVLVAVVFLFLNQNESVRRHRLRKIVVYSLAALLAPGVVRVNEHVAPLHAQRLINAVEDYRATTGAYPKKLEDVVPEFIDKVPRPQYTLGSMFFYVEGLSRGPVLWYNPHGMDHRRYHFTTKEWTYLD